MVFNPGFERVTHGDFVFGATAAAARLTAFGLRGCRSDDVVAGGCWRGGKGGGWRRHWFVGGKDMGEWGNGEWGVGSVGERERGKKEKGGRKRDKKEGGSGVVRVRFGSCTTP